MKVYTVAQRVKGRRGRAVVGEFTLSDSRTDRISIRGELRSWLWTHGGIHLHECRRGLYVVRVK